MSTTEDRMETLEKQVRRQRRWNIALGGVLLLSGCIATTNSQTIPDVIQAKRFEVVNDEGKVIVLMNSVFDQGEHYGFVATQNGKGQTLVRLGVTVDGEGRVITTNGKGEQLVELGATTGGGGSVVTKNGKGQTLVRVGTTMDGGGSVVTKNGKGQALVHIASDTDGGHLRTANTSGQSVTFVGSNSGGSGVLVTLDGDEITSETPSP